MGRASWNISSSEPWSNSPPGTQTIPGGAIEAGGFAVVAVSAGAVACGERPRAAEMPVSQASRCFPSGLDCADALATGPFADGEGPGDCRSVPPLREQAAAAQDRTTADHWNRERMARANTIPTSLAAQGPGHPGTGVCQAEAPAGDQGSPPVSGRRGFPASAPAGPSPRSTG